jgi:uncharacterized membrane protein YdjX (TVP38/TMEM64 family)
MTRYWAIVGTVLAVLLAGFLVAEAVGFPLLTDPTARLTRGGVLGAILAVALLTVDAVLPVPASLVMVASGALYGTLAGILLALLGRVLMALAGYAIGKRGGLLVARLVPRDERERADGLLRRWGLLAIVMTRPVPLLAETMTILAGVSEIGWGRVALAALVGSVPEAVLYAGSGALAYSVEEAGLIWVALLLLTGTFWIIGRWADHRPTAPGQPAQPLQVRTPLRTASGFGRDQPWRRNR